MGCLSGRALSQSKRHRHPPESHGVGPPTLTEGPPKTLDSWTAPGRDVSSQGLPGSGPGRLSVSPVCLSTTETLVDREVRQSQGRVWGAWTTLRSGVGLVL